jgi:hypothetical protein
VTPLGAEPRGSLAALGREATAGLAVDHSQIATASGAHSVVNLLSPHPTALTGSGHHSAGPQHRVKTPTHERTLAISIGWLLSS